MEPPGTATDVDRTTKRLLGKQGPFRPSVRLLEVDDSKWVAKDYRACTPLYRWTVGRWNIARETRALARLDGMEGVPRLEGRAGRWILILSFFRGTDVGKTPKLDQTPGFFEELRAIVTEMHRRGVLHLDLRQRRNVFVQPDGRPAVIDFGASLCVRPGGFLARLLGRIDVSGVLKYKRRADPGSLSADETSTLERVERRRRFWPFS